MLLPSPYDGKNPRVTASTTCPLNGHDRKFCCYNLRIGTPPGDVVATPGKISHAGYVSGVRKEARIVQQFGALRGLVNNAGVLNADKARTTRRSVTPRVGGADSVPSEPLADTLVTCRTVFVRPLRPGPRAR